MNSKQMLVGALCLSIITAANATGSKKGRAIPTHQEKNNWYKAGKNTVANRGKDILKSGNARNIILFVGDGMGVSTVTAARILVSQP